MMIYGSGSISSTPISFEAKMESCAAMHKRCKSEGRTYEHNKTMFTASQPVKMILQLQKELMDQFVIRKELEKATADQPPVNDLIDESSLPKRAKDLIKEISILEFEVKHLEEHLLSLYRNAFQEFFNPIAKGPTKESYVQRSQSSLSSRINLRGNIVREALDSYHTLPLTLLECFSKEKQLNKFAHKKKGCNPLWREKPLIRPIDDLSSTSLAEHREICASANQLSEEMVKCICSIYCQIADPPLVDRCPLSSPSDFSPRDEFGVWSPQREVEKTWLHKHNDSEPSMEFSDSCSSVVEVQGICKNDQRSSKVERKQRNYRQGRNVRSLVSQLEQVDPRMLKYEEKLAFWINVHNALVMHAYLVYGTASSTLKRISAVLKASYNIGGHNISVGDIQRTILGCRLPRPGQWLQSLLFPMPRGKSRDARKDYAIVDAQPLLYFALCSGSHSDPMLRIYTPKSIFHDLEVAREEYIHTNVRIHQGHKLFVPKLLELYMKDSSLCVNGLMDIIEHSMPEFYLKSFKVIRTGGDHVKINRKQRYNGGGCLVMKMVEGGFVVEMAGEILETDIDDSDMQQKVNLGNNKLKQLDQLSTVKDLLICLLCGQEGGSDRDV
ncbi:uncharacterized protein [Rutidosis leptorrhynchoides]|uniref:uncharacterized protein n=1 Tax=Rutidosis leptorrhynchoides TaxID=125765 RepID=UPI003A9A166C